MVSLPPHTFLRNSHQENDPKFKPPRTLAVPDRMELSRRKKKIPNFKGLPAAFQSTAEVKARRFSFEAGCLETGNLKKILESRRTGPAGKLTDPDRVRRKRPGTRCHAKAL